MVAVLDFDGTLHDTAYIYWVAINDAWEFAASKGIVKPRHLTVEETSEFLGVTPEDTWHTLIPGIDDDTMNRAIDITAETMDRLISQGKSKLYDGAIDVLKELRDHGIKIVILSNCTIGYMESHRRAWHLDEYTDGLYPAERYGYMSKADILDIIRKDFPDEKVFVPVGDRYSDIEGGIRDGFPTVGCLYGFGKPGEIDKATYKINSIKELPAILYNIENK